MGRVGNLNRMCQVYRSAWSNVACEAQTHFRSSLLSLRKNKRKCLCASQARCNDVVRYIDDDPSQTKMEEFELKNSFCKGIACSTRKL